MNSLKNFGENVWEKLKDVWYFLDDACRELRIRYRKEKNRRARLKKALPPEKYQAYLKKYRMRAAVKAGILLICAALCILLLLGVGKLIGMAGRAIFSPRTQAEQTEPETETAGTETEAQSERVYPEADITVGATGCMLLHSPFMTSYPDAEGNYDFSSIYRFITPYYSAPDYMTCEFEGALGGEELGYSGYPNFKSPDAIIENIRDSGVDLQLLATNHIYDAWSAGFRRTMEVYDEKGIAFTGVRRNEQEKHYYIADINGVTVGFVNYVYETTNVTSVEYGPGKSINGMILETQDAPLLNSFNYADLPAFYTEMENNIYAMRADGARFIIANLHWGNEYQLEEADYQREIAQALCDMGVDAIIGGHPHCEQPIDVLRSADGAHQMFCIYSVGNALSNQRTYLMQDDMPTGHTEDGVMVTLHLHQSSSGSVAITDVDLLPTWVYRYTADTGSKYYILPLDNVDAIEQTTGISDIYQEAQASYARTMEELGPGLEQAKAAFQAPRQ